jgi:hypothetical protein
VREDRGSVNDMEGWWMQFMQFALFGEVTHNLDCGIGMKRSNKAKGIETRKMGKRMAYIIQQDYEARRSLASLESKRM